MTCGHDVLLTRHSTYNELLSNFDTITYRKRKRCSTYAPCTRTAIMFCPLPFGPPCSPKHCCSGGARDAVHDRVCRFLTHTRNHYPGAYANITLRQERDSVRHIRVVQACARYFTLQPLFPGPRLQNESLRLGTRDAVHLWSACPFIYTQSYSWPACSLPFPHTR